MIIFTKDHKEIVGAVDGKPFKVLFDEDGFSEVEEAVGEQLLQLESAVKVEESTEEIESSDVAKLGDLNVMQLKKFARENGIDFGNATKKVELLEIINGALASANTQENHE